MIENNKKNKAYCLKEIMTVLNTNNIPYDTNFGIEVINKALIITDIFIYPLMLGIDILDPIDASVDTNKHITRNHLQKRALFAHSAHCSLVQLTTAEFINSNVWNFIKSHIEAHATTRKKLGARQCALETINYKERHDFLTKWHAKTDVQNTSSAYGLRFEKELVALLSIGSSRYTAKQYELIRYCVHPNYAISGGFNKLLQRAIKDLPANSTLISYADLNYSLKPQPIYADYFVYEGVTAPDYKWINPETNEILSRYSVMKHKLVKEGYNPQLTEREIMLSRGFIRVFGTGSLIYKLTT